MALDQRAKWDQRFARAKAINPPAQVLQRNSHLLSSKGRALEIACGLGGNSLFLAGQGYQVDALDISGVALQKLSAEAERRGLFVNTVRTDVEKQFSNTASYDLIVVSHFLYRPLCPALAKALKPGGLLFYQTFTRDARPDNGPSNPAWCLRRNELLELFAGLELVYYREEAELGQCDTKVGGLACYVGRKSQPTSVATSGRDFHT